MKKAFPPVLFLFLVSIFFLAPVLFSGETFFIRDILAFFHPQQTLVNEMLQRGEMPLWNPYGYSGMPLLATWQSRIFSPLSLPFYFFGFVPGMKVFYLICMSLSGFFCFAFFRNKKFSNPSSLAAAILWILNGYFITKFEFFSILSTLTFAFAPIAVISSPILSAIALSFAFMGGYPTFFLILICYFVIVLTENREQRAENREKTNHKNTKKEISHRWTQMNTERKQKSLIFLICGYLWLSVVKYPFCFFRNFVILRLRGNLSKKLAIALVVFLGIVAVQLLPTAELVLNSSRSGGVEEKVAFTHSLKLSELKNIILPSAEEKSTGAKYHWFKTSYIGFGAFALIVFAAFKVKNLLLPFVFMAVGVLLSLGDTTPIYPFLYKIFFPLRLIRYPSVMLFFVVFGATFFVSTAIDELKNFKVKILMLIFIVTELFFWGFRHQVLANSDIFFAKPPAVDIIRQGGWSRFILTPKMLSDVIIKDETIPRAWWIVRKSLRGFTSWPYHLFNAYGTGEPLTLYGSEMAVDSAYSKTSPDEAFGDFENMGVSYLVSNTKLPEASKFVLQNSAPPFIYKTKSANSIFYLTDISQSGLQGFSADPKYREPLEPTHFSESKIKFEIDRSKHPRLRKNAKLVHLENHYPGWQAYADGRKISIDRYENYYKSIKMPKAAEKIILMYRPFFFNIGVLLTVIFVTCIVIKIRQDIFGVSE